jgi:formylglycine-generating enzyme required for sulfatase activity
MNADGTNVNRLTKNHDADFEPVWAAGSVSPSVQLPTSISLNTITAVATATETKPATPTVPPTIPPTEKIRLAPTLAASKVEDINTPVSPTPTPTLTTTATPTLTASPTLTLTATDTPIASYTPTVSLERIALTPIVSNPDWTPYERDFNGVTMMFVPPGCFDLGGTSHEDEKPIQEMCFTQPFWIDKTEVTQGQFAKFGGKASRPSYFLGVDRPVEQITWMEARDFCANQRGVRLPTEVEWDYAARGPDSLMYPWGNKWNGSKAVLNRDSSIGTANVGSIPEGKSWIGALDLSGNVWEWTSSVHKPYPYKANDGREANNTTSFRATRGGSWLNGDPDQLRSAFRFRINPRTADTIFGFRCARDFDSGS